MSGPERSGGGRSPCGVEGLWHPETTTAAPLVVYRSRVTSRQGSTPAGPRQARRSSSEAVAQSKWAGSVHESPGPRQRVTASILSWSAVTSMRLPRACGFDWLRRPQNRVPARRPANHSHSVERPIPAKNQRTVRPTDALIANAPAVVTVCLEFRAPVVCGPRPRGPDSSCPSSWPPTGKQLPSGGHGFFSGTRSPEKWLACRLKSHDLFGHDGPRWSRPGQPTRGRQSP